jgi:hypothetical protein
MNTGPFFGWEAFGPDDIKAISIALDEVCSKLGLTDDKQEEEKFSRSASWPLRATANAILRPSATASCESLP